MSKPSEMWQGFGPEMDMNVTVGDATGEGVECPRCHNRVGWLKNSLGSGEPSICESCVSDLWYHARTKAPPPVPKD